MLDLENTVLVIVDVQDKLASVMSDKDELFLNLDKLIRGAQALGVPIVVTEQYPQGLGRTIPQLARFLSDVRPIAKLSFSCCGEESFLREIKTLNRRQALVAGIESHVCVYQTVADLLGIGYEVQVVGDAVSSRTAGNKEIALDKMRSAGAGITSTEMALFELLRVARGEVFKEIIRIVR
ncbi:MAG: hydrolase [Dehalococcoidales bacterium]|nr:hydrolase [Dehalococcoidales bacterium]